MRYVEARADEERRHTAYRIYVTDALKGLVGFDIRYIDLFTTPKPKPKPKDVVDKIKSKLGAS